MEDATLAAASVEELEKLLAYELKQLELAEAKEVEARATLAGVGKLTKEDSQQDAVLMRQHKEAPPAPSTSSNDATGLATLAEGRLAGEEAEGEEGELSKSKKKRKKKAKKAEGDGGDTGAIELEDGEAGHAAGARPDAQERYAAAMELLRGDGDDGSAAWVSLSRCGIGDKKLRKLVEILKANPQGSSSLTSIDLSHNAISDVAAAALVDALQLPAVAPCLLELSLSGNPLSAAGCATCAQAVRAAFVDIKLTLPRPVPSVGAMANTAPATSASSALSSDAGLPSQAVSTPTSTPGFELEGEGARSVEAAGATSAGTEPPGPLLDDSLMLLTRWAEDGGACRAEHSAALSAIVKVAEAAVEEAAAAAAAAAEKCAPPPAELQQCAQNVPTFAKVLAFPGAEGKQAKLGSHVLLLLKLFTLLVRAKHPTVTDALLAHRSPPPNFGSDVHSARASHF